MEYVKLSDLIRKGFFGSISLGDTMQKVEQVLGKPEKTSSENIPGLIWKFGNLEITFGNEGVACVFFNISNIDLLWKTIHIEDIHLFIGMSSKEFELLSSKMGINGFKRGMDIGDGKIYFLQNYVNVSFTKNILTSMSICDPQRIP